MLSSLRTRLAIVALVALAPVLALTACGDESEENDSGGSPGTGGSANGCPEGLTGSDCQTVVGSCDDAPCQNGGSCSDSMGEISCECIAPFTGPICNEVVGSCDDHGCENGATCVDGDGAYRCDCADGFLGTFCEDLAPVVPPQCLPNPCENEGQCRADGDGFACDCPFEFSGPTCGEAAPVGLTARPSNTTCIAPARPMFTGPVTWTVARSGRANLMMMRQLPDDQWLEIYRNGDVFLVAANGTRGASAIFTVPNVSSTGEMGLLGLAVHPAFTTSSNNYVYFYYTSIVSGDVHIRIDRFTTTGSGASLDINGASRLSMLDFDRGESWGNHIGGSLEFDPAAAVPTLYAATGDGEQPSQVQQTGNYFGKLLRFAVDSAPQTPVVVGVGLRNPFRFSMDSLTGDLWIGDVGDGTWEEVNHVVHADLPGTSGMLNFGWPIMEGPECRTGSNPATYCGQSAPSVVPLRAPVHAYKNTNATGGGIGVSVIGGRVYRGSTIAGLSGTYVFNDYWPSNGEGSWRLLPNPSQSPSDPSDDYTRGVITGGGNFVAFAEGNNGDLFGINTNVNTIYRLTASGGGGNMETMAANLSGTGCFESGAAPGPALVAYDLNSPLWSDGATKKRWLSLPNGQTATLTESGDFDFPNGTILAKEFSVDGVRVETRLFVRHPDGVWAGYSYAWITSGGTLAADGQLLSDAVVTRSVPGTTKSWTYPSRSQCTQCHTAASGGSLGVEVGQLNRDFDYPNSLTANQLHTLSEIGMLGGDLDPFIGRAFAEYDDESKSIEDRTWSYLHSNCAGCHQPGEAGMQGRSAMPDLRYDLFESTTGTHPLAERLCGVEPGAGDLGLGHGAKLVEPGAPGSWGELSSPGSVLYLRMSARPNVSGSTGTMPQLGTAHIDDEFGLPLTREWIENLTCE